MKKESIRKIFWIIGGSQLQAPLIKEVHRLGLDVLITDRNPECMCKNLGEYFYPVDVFDLQKNIELLFQLQSQGARLAGILAAGIDANVTAAALARLANLPGVDPKAAFITHNKAAFRKFLTEHNLPHPQWREVKDERDVKEAITKIGFPLIIKNVDSSASRGTKKFFSPAPWAELYNVFRSAQEVSSTHTALVEELLDGEEQTVETLFDAQGVFRPCFITDRFFEDKNVWATEQGLRHPSALPPKTQKQLYALVRRTAQALGITIGAAKADTIITKKGPMIIEMTTRLSGGFDCQYLVPAATGKNILRAAILTALGKPFNPSLLRDTKKRIALSASLWPAPGSILTGISGLKNAKRIPGFENFFLTHQVGEMIQPYSDSAKRVCYIIVSGPEELSARKTLGKVSQAIKLQTQQADV